MSTPEKENTKYGKTHKCPACGAEVNQFQVKCPECGYEFSNVTANETTSNLTAKLDQIDVECASMNQPELAIQRKVQTIQNFPIPNTRADLLEMMTLCHANIAKTSDKVLAEAWAVKTEQLVSKAEILLKGDKDAEVLINKIKATEKGQKKKKTVMMSIIGAVVAVVLGVGGFGWYAHSEKDSEQDAVIAEWQMRISDAVQEAEYAYAYDYLDSLNLYIESQDVDRKVYQEAVSSSYLKLVMALLREDALEDAATVGLDYRDRIKDPQAWHESQIYKLLKQACEAQNVDDSVLE